MSVASEIIKTSNHARVLHGAIGAVASIILIVSGFLLTQKQMELPQNDSTSEIILNAKIVEFKSTSTYPGITLITCGTFIACATILKKYKAKTQWKDENYPGFTEVES